jgi:PAS domain S-box-containing protein
LEKWFDSLTKERMAGLVGVLAYLYHSDLASGPSATLSLSRCLEEVSSRYSLEGCSVMRLRGDETEVIARHGAGESCVEKIAECFKAKISKRPAATCHHDATSAHHGAATDHHDAAIDDHGAGPSICPPAPETETLSIDGRQHHISGFRLEDDQWCLVDFVPTDNVCSPAQELSLIAMHLCGTVMRLGLHDEALAAKESLDRLNRELKEMHVCSLNIMEDLQKKNRDLSMLNEVSRSLASWKSLPELAGNAAKAASGILNGARAIVYVRDEARDFYHPYLPDAEDGIGDSRPDAVPCSKALADRIKNREELTFDACGDDLIEEIAGQTGYRSGLLVPLLSKDEVMGFILACETRWHRVFTGEEIENLKVLATTLAVAMENADLLSRLTKQVGEMGILNEYIATVVDSIDLGVMVIDKDLTITVLNKGFERLYGYKRDDFQGKNVFEALPHLVEQGFGELAQQVLKGKPFVRYGWRRRLLDGNEVVQNFRVFPHRDSSGNIIGGIAIIEDITEKAGLENQLVKSENKFSRLVEDLDDGYLIAVDEKITYANRAVSHLTGTPLHELIGSPVSGILGEEDMLSSFAGPVEEKIVCESKLTHSTGTWIPVEVSLNSCDYGDGRAISVVIRDITKTRKFERQLETKNREMRLRNEQITRLNLELEGTINKLKDSQESLVKSERIAAITQTSVATNHEINNPLFAILGQAQLMLREFEGKDEDILRRLRTIEESALRIACVTKKLANLADPVVKEYSGISTTMIDVDKSTSK